VAVVPTGISAMMTIDHCLGRLAATLGQSELAETPFQRSLAQCERNGAVTLVPAPSWRTRRCYGHSSSNPIEPTPWRPPRWSYRPTSDWAIHRSCDRSPRVNLARLLTGCVVVPFDDPLARATGDG
jgi:hypothetical protein